MKNLCDYATSVVKQRELIYFNFRMRFYEGLCPSQSDLFLLASHQNFSTLFNSAINC